MASRILAEKTAVWKVDGKYYETYEGARKALMSMLVADLISEAQNFEMDIIPQRLADAIADRIDAIQAEVKEALDKVPAASLSARIGPEVGQ